MLRPTGTFVRVFLRFLTCGLALAAGSLFANAQQVQLALGSGSTLAGTSVSVNLTLTNSGGAAPTGLQWRMTYPLASIGAVNFTAGPAAVAAGKTLTCANNAGWVDCVLFGVNSTPISGGVIATANITTLPVLAAVGANLGMANSASTDSTAYPLLTSATGGLLSILLPTAPPPSTWTISGTVSSGSGAAMSLSGAASKTTTADASGNYSFTGLANGTYTVSAEKSGFSMTPASRVVTVNGSNIQGVNFTAAAVTSTWTISGNVSSGSGASVSLSGTAGKTTTADASGNYLFPGLLNGSYTITAAKSGFSMTPSSRAVTVSSANVSAVNFIATAVPATWSISGTITSGSGATVSLGGAATKTTTADGSGRYSFAGLANGTYTVAPWKSGLTFTPSARTVSLSNADQTADFAGSQLSSSVPTVDSTVWVDRWQASSTFSSPAFSTNQANELLLAFVSTDAGWGTETVRTVSGAGLKWVLVKRTNTQEGTAEIWRAFAPQALRQVVVSASLSRSLSGSMTVMSFAGVDSTGTSGSGAIGATGSGQARIGAPTATLVPSRSQSLVVGVGNDPNTDVDRTPVEGQSIVHQYSVGRSANYWVQKVNNPTTAGVAVTVRDYSPSNSAYNLSIVEVRGSSATGLDMLSAAPDAAGKTTATGSSSLEPETASRRSAAAVTLTNPVTGEASDACSPGGWASLVGRGFTTQRPQSPETFPVPLALGGVRVSINGQPAPMLLASSEQVNFQCPQLAVGTGLRIELTTEAGAIWTVPATVMRSAAPALFTVEGTQRAVVQIAATNQQALALDSGSGGRPARAGDHIRLYASGLGEVEDISTGPVASGMPTPMDKPIRIKNRVLVMIGGVEVEPIFAGLAPGMVGVYQLDLEVPDTATGADIPLFLRLELADGTPFLSQQTVVAIGGDAVRLAAQQVR